MIKSSKIVLEIVFFFFVCFVLLFFCFVLFFFVCFFLFVFFCLFVVVFFGEQGKNLTCLQFRQF